MMYLVTAYFDEETFRRCSKLMEKIELKCENSFMKDNNIPPHMTLIQFHTREDEEAVVSAFEKVIWPENGFDVQFEKSFSGIPGVACVSVVKNDFLQDFHRMVFECFESIPQTIMDRHYSPENYFPHVTVGKMLSDEQKKIAEKLMESQNRIPDGRVVKITLTQGKPPRLVSSVEV